VQKEKRSEGEENQSQKLLSREEGRGLDWIKGLISKFISFILS
jgi:hypothetical protein